jgi:large subunit ribosomal protein L15
MKLNSIKPKRGATHRSRNLGRGNGSGHGTFCGRGCKGQGQRQGGNVRPGFEGGQTPLIRRLPKLRGFTNLNRVSFQTVNVESLNRFKDGDEITPLSLFQHKLIRRKDCPVKLLGDGILERKLTIKVHKVSATAKEKVAKAGGKVIQ